MLTPAEQTQVLYELSMAVGTSLDLSRMLRHSLSTILRRLNCSAGGVHLARKAGGGGHRCEQVFSIPRDTSRIREYRAAADSIGRGLDEGSLSTFRSALPVHGQTDPGRHFHILDLPDVGFVVMVKNGDRLDPLFVKSLGPVFSKLAEACRACIQNEELIMHRTHLEDMVREKTDELVVQNRKLAEKVREHREMENRFRLAAQAMSDLIYEWDLSDDTLRWFGDIDGALGFEGGEFPHTLEAWIGRIHPDDRARLSVAVVEVKRVKADGENQDAALRKAEPRRWLPFVTDEHLRAWRDWLVEQLVPGHTVQTAQVFARRMGVSVAEMEAVLVSPHQMEQRVFCRIPRTALQSFHDIGYARSVASITRYIGGLVDW